MGQQTTITRQNRNCGAKNTHHGGKPAMFEQLPEQTSATTKTPQKHQKHQTTNQTPNNIRKQNSNTPNTAVSPKPPTRCCFKIVSLHICLKTKNMGGLGKMPMCWFIVFCSDFFVLIVCVFGAFAQHLPFCPMLFDVCPHNFDVASCFGVFLPQFACFPNDLWFLWPTIKTSVAKPKNPGRVCHKFWQVYHNLAEVRLPVGGGPLLRRVPLHNSSNTWLKSGQRAGVPPFAGGPNDSAGTHWPNPGSRKGWPSLREGPMYNFSTHWPSRGLRRGGCLPARFLLKALAFGRPKPQARYIIAIVYPKAPKHDGQL